MHALRRRYPQVYTSKDKLQIDVSAIEVSAKDFSKAMDGIVPTAQRSVASPGRALKTTVQPLLQAVLDKTINVLSSTFPAGPLAKIASLDVPGKSSLSSSPLTVK